MGIPILDSVLRLVEEGIDKIWPDANTKEQAKIQVQSIIISKAMQSEQLLFQDTEGARELFKIELEAKNTPRLVRGLQVLARPITMYAMVGMYVYVKIAPLAASWFGKTLPELELNDYDYYLIGMIFVFLFGARTIEKLKGKAGQ